VQRNISFRCTDDHGGQHKPLMRISYSGHRKRGMPVMLSQLMVD